MKVPQRYHPFNPHVEDRRLRFILERDGPQVLLTYAPWLKRVYLGAALGTRKSTRARNHPYRYMYVEAAFALRRFLRLPNVRVVKVPTGTEDHLLQQVAPITFEWLVKPTTKTIRVPWKNPARG